MSDLPQEDSSMSEFPTTQMVWEDIRRPTIQLFDEVCAKREEWMELLEASSQLSKRLAALSLNSAPKLESGLSAKV